MSPRTSTRSGSRCRSRTPWRPTWRTGRRTPWKPSTRRRRRGAGSARPGRRGRSVPGGRGPAPRSRSGASDRNRQTLPRRRSRSRGLPRAGPRARPRRCPLCRGRSGPSPPPSRSRSGRSGRCKQGRLRAKRGPRFPQPLRTERANRSEVVRLGPHRPALEARPHRRRSSPRLPGSGLPRGNRSEDPEWFPRRRTLHRGSRRPRWTRPTPAGTRPCRPASRRRVSRRAASAPRRRQSTARQRPTWCGGL